jgi:hypothetical protein
MILCECGKFIEGCTFKCYIKTSSNPSTPTIGHRRCGLVFDFIDGMLPKRYSSKIELKSIALHFAEINELDYQEIERLLIEVDRLKSKGKLSDMQILLKAFCILRKANKI